MYNIPALQNTEASLLLQYCPIPEDAFAFIFDIDVKDVKKIITNKREMTPQQMEFIANYCAAFLKDEEQNTEAAAVMVLRLLNKKLSETTNTQNPENAQVFTRERVSEVIEAIKASTRLRGKVLRTLAEVFIRNGNQQNTR